jgi:hypothetical protein
LNPRDADTKAQKQGSAHLGGRGPVTTISETIAELADEARARPLVIVYWSFDGVVLDRLPFWTGHGAVRSGCPLPGCHAESRSKPTLAW